MDTHKKELIQEYKQRPLTGGVCIIRNVENGRYKLYADANLQGSENRFGFAQMTNTPPMPSMGKDWENYGRDAFVFEILEEMMQKPEQTKEEFMQDVKTLGTLWAERYDPKASY